MLISNLDLTNGEQVKNYSPPCESKAESNSGEGVGSKNITLYIYFILFLLNSFLKKVFTYSPYLV